MASAAEPHARELRVFISSTFRDMHAERNELVKRVFPQIRELCRARGVEWSEVDLRWGVTDEQRAEGKTLPLCLSEIDRCRPYFIGLLGERYGWIPEVIPPALIERLPWLAGLDRSVTELEILHAVLNDPTATEHAFFYFRDPAWPRRADVHGSVFREVPSPEEVETYGAERAEERAAARRRKLAELKQRIRASGCRVREDYREPRELGELVLRDLTSLVERLYPPEALRDPIAEESGAHDRFARRRRRGYVPRPAVSRQLGQMIQDCRHGLIVEGNLGSGKTALLSDLYLNRAEATRAGPWSAACRWAGFPPEAVVLAHFVGATPGSPDWKALIRRIVTELKRRFRLRGVVPTDAEDLGYALTDFLPRVRGDVLLILDGLDRLEDVDDAHDLAWLPETTPGRVRIVASAAPGRCLDALRRRPWPRLVLGGLERQERTEIAVSHLHRYGKSLSQGCLARIAAAPQTGDPLFLVTLLEELRLFGVYEGLERRLGACLSARDAEDLYFRILARHEADFDADWPHLVRDAMSLLWAAQRGLTENELLELLGRGDAPLPRLGWTALSLAIEESLVRHAGALLLANEPLRRAVRRRYLESREVRLRLHGYLADYFQKAPRSDRVVDERLRQFAAAERWAELATALADFDLMAAAQAGRSRTTARHLLAYWSLRKGKIDPRKRSRLAAAELVAERGESSETAELLREAGAFLHELGYPAAARELAERASEIRGRSDRRNHLGILRTLMLIGRTYQAEEHWSDALSHFQRGCDLSRRRTGRRSGEYAECRVAVAGVMAMQGNYTEALSVMDGAQATYNRVYGAQSDAALGLANNRVYVLQKLARYDDARRIARQIYEARVRRFGTDHPDVAWALISLGALDLVQGRYGDAVDKNGQALAIRERTLGQEHPKTVAAQHNLATCYLEMGQFARALPLMERCLRATRARRGDGHSEVGIEAFSLAECYRRLQRYEEAETSLREAIGIFDIAGDRFKRSAALMSLGALELARGRPAEAAASFREATTLREQLLGPAHPETAAARVDLGIGRSAAGEWALAREDLRVGVRDLAASLGLEHSQVAAVIRRAIQLAVEQEDTELQASLASVRGTHRDGSTATTAPTATAPPDAAPHRSTPPGREEVEGVSRLLRELEVLAGASLPPSRLALETLRRAARATGAKGGAVWRVDRTGDVSLEFEERLPEECRPERVPALRHFRLLRRVAEQRLSIAAAPGSWDPELPDVVNPTPYSLLLAELPAGEGQSYVCEAVFDRLGAEDLRQRLEVFRRFLAAARPISSAEPSSPSVEELQKNLLRLVEEIDILAQSELDPPFLLRAFVVRFARAVGAQGAGIWIVSYHGEPCLQLDGRVPKNLVGDGPDVGQHRALLDGVARIGWAGAITPGGGVPGVPEAVNATPYLLLVGRLAETDEGRLVFEAFLADRTDQRVVEGMARFLLRVAAPVAASLERHYRGKAGG